MNTSNIDNQLLGNDEAMRLFRIKDPRTWRNFQRVHKIPYMRIGGRKLFYKDVLLKIALKAMEATARKVYV